MLENACFSPEKEENPVSEETGCVVDDVGLELLWPPVSACYSVLFAVILCKIQNFFVL